MYSNFSIDNFRGISNIFVQDLGRVNVFVGKNNCGKTSVLEALFLCTGGPNAHLPISVNGFRDLHILDDGAWTIFFYGFNDTAPIVIKAKRRHSDDQRILCIKPRRSGVTYSPLNDKQREMGAVAPSRVESAPGAVADGLILEYTLERAGEVRVRISVEAAAQAGGLRITNPPPDFRDEIRGIFVNTKTVSLDLARRFTELQIRKQTDRLLAILKEMEPALRSIASGADGLLYCDIGLERMLPVNVMGDGMYRLLAFLLAIAAVPGGVVFLDEVENGFHYSSQGILWKGVMAAARDFGVQVFAATHSIESLRALAACCPASGEGGDEVRVFRLERKAEVLRSIAYDCSTLALSIQREREVR